MKFTSAESDQSPDLRTIRTLLPYLWPKKNFSLRFRVILSVFFLVVAKVTNIYVPLFYKRAVDAFGLDVQEAGWVVLPIALVLAYGAARIGAQVFDEMKGFIFVTVEQNAVRSISLKTFQYLHDLGLRFHLDRKTGAVSRVVERGANGIQTVLRFLAFNIVPTFVEIFFVGILLWYLYDFRFAIVVFITLGTYIWYTIYFTEWRLNFVRQMHKADNAANAKAVDSLLNFETVKYFGNETHEANRYDASLANYEKSFIKSHESLCFLNIGQGVIIALGLISVMSMAGYGVLEKTLTLGDFVLMNAYLIQLYLPLGILGFAYREIKLSLVNMEEMFELLRKKKEIQDVPEARTLLPSKGEVVFDHVGFAYNPDRPILKDISFEVPAGHSVGIVGASGAGKSTISRLLFRFFDVTKGRILIDGEDIREVTQASLRAAIGIVPQDTVLFNETIYYNIAYGRPEATEEEVHHAAKLAKIHKFVEDLPQGYDTLVGERGLKLSGGEKQRVAIARTLLKKPQIFLFDEATSALDTATEKEIQKSLKEVSARHTTLMIAHRLSTVVDADEILVFEKGEILERGSHKELLALGGTYAEMWDKQRSESEKTPQVENPS